MVACSTNFKSLIERSVKCACIADLDGNGLEFNIESLEIFKLFCFCEYQDSYFCLNYTFFLLDVGIDVFSTNGSQEPHGPCLLKVSGLERSQERSEESCRDYQPSASTITDPPQTQALSQQQLLSSVPLPASPCQTQLKDSTQVLASTYPTSQSEALPRPQTPASLLLVHGKKQSPPSPPCQNELDRHCEAPPRPSNHLHPPQPLLPTHHPHQQHPSKAKLQQPPSRCQVWPLPSCNNFKGLR